MILNCGQKAYVSFKSCHRVVSLASAYIDFLSDLSLIHPTGNNLSRGNKCLFGWSRGYNDVVQ